MLKLKYAFLTIVILIATVYPALADSVWIGRDNGATQCGCSEGRPLEQDRAALSDLGIETTDGCTAHPAIYTCHACCVCSEGIYNFFLIDSRDLEAAQDAGWSPFLDKMPCR